MSSYQTVQVVVFSGAPIANQDYMPAAPGYTISNGSVSFGIGGPGSSGTSFTPTSDLSWGAPAAGNVLMGLPYFFAAAGSGCSVTYDKAGRITAVATSISTKDVTGSWTTNAIVGSWTTNSIVGSWTTNSIVGSWTTNSIVGSWATNSIAGVWTSGVSSSDIQGLGSTWTVSRLSSALSIVGNEVWASGVSVGSILSTSRVSSAGTILAAAVWASGFSALGSIATVSRVSSDASVVANEVWASGVSVISIVTASRVSSSNSVVANEVWASGISVISIVTSPWEFYQMLNIAALGF